MRETFALQPAVPADFRPHLTGQTRGAQIVGGESRGGVVAAGPQTDAGPVAAGLGQMVEQIMRPHMQRRQQEEFFKGFTKAQSGVAIEEISKSGGAFSKVFGPTAYEEGAAFYAARTQLTGWAQERYAELDTLKKLPPEEQAKLLAEKSAELMTGDSETDKLIQAGLMEQSGPLMNTIGKARYAWQQDDARTKVTGAWRSDAKTLQMAGEAQADFGSPTDEQQSAMVAQAQAFASGMAKPHGMDDETYRKGLFDFMRQAMQDGNFHAVRVLQRYGVDSIFDDAERVKLEDARQRYEDRHLEDFTATDPGFKRRYEAYEVRRALTAAGEKGGYTALEASSALAEMNAYIQQKTGIEGGFFEFKEIRGEVRHMLDLIVAAKKRADDRKWQLEDREYAREARRQERAEELAETSRFAGMAWATGDVERAMAEGIEARHFNRIALAEFRRGNLAGLARAFKVGHYISPSVRQDILGPIEGSLEEQYGKNFAGVHQQWQKMMAVNPGMTASYFGEYHEKMRTFTTLSKQLGPNAAYRRAFGDPARYANASIPEGRRKEAHAAIDAWANSQQPSRLNIFAHRLDAGALKRLKGAMERRLGAALRNSDDPVEPLISEVGQAIFADGSAQIVGGKFWTEAPGTKPFRVQVGLHQDEADKVFRSVVDARLKRAGLQAGVNADLSIHYINNPQGRPMLQVVGRDSEGDVAGTTIPMSEFKEAHRRGLAASPAHRSAEQLAKAQAAAREAARAGLDPDRRVTGETVRQRVARQNRENVEREKLRPKPQVRVDPAEVRRSVTQTLPGAGVIEGVAGVIGGLAGIARNNKERRKAAKKK